MINQKTTKEIVDDCYNMKGNFKGNEVWFLKEDVVTLLNKYLLVNYPLLNKARKLIEDIDNKAKTITEEFNAIVAKMDAVRKEMFERVKTNVPAELYVKYEAQKKAKEDKELERNKIGLKVQKRN